MATNKPSILPLILIGALVAYGLGFQLPIDIGDVIPPIVNPDVENKHGVGIPAYKEAPRDGQAAKVASIYKQSADFLMGKPSMKSVRSSNAKDNDDPKRNVFAWQHQQFESIEGWDKWRGTMAEAIKNSQGEKAFSRNDWFEVFNEIANALEKVN